MDTNADEIQKATRTLGFTPERFRRLPLEEARRIYESALRHFVLVMPVEYSEHQRIPMQYLIIDAAQDPTFAHEKEYGGATVGCWIKNQTKQNAYLIAKGWIENHGWAASQSLDP